MADRVHEMTGERGPDGLLLTCGVCPRRVVVKDSRELVVLDRGDFYAQHSPWLSNPELSTGASLEVADG